MIERKKKKCKRGTGPAKGFEGCGNEKFLHRYSLCQDCFKDWLFNTEAGQETLKKSTLQGKKRAEKKEKEDHKRLKEESKSISQLIQQARLPFQKLIRIRDHGQNCICCDNPLPFSIGEYDAGHYLKAELYTGLIFHPDNVHGQLVRCNKYEHGNETGYIDGILKRIGKERLERINSVKNELKSYKWERIQLKKLKKYYSYELRLVERGFKNIKDVDLTVGIVE